MGSVYNCDCVDAVIFNELEVGFNDSIIFIGSICRKSGRQTPIADVWTYSIWAKPTNQKQRYCSGQDTKWPIEDIGKPENENACWQRPGWSYKKESINPKGSAEHRHNIPKNRKQNGKPTIEVEHNSKPEIQRKREGKPKKQEWQYGGECAEKTVGFQFKHSLIFRNIWEKHTTQQV